MRANARWLEGLWTDEILEGTWVGGNNYKGSGFYGAYPPNYLDRVWALFPDFLPGTGKRVLHAFSGSLQRPGTHGLRVDIKHQPVKTDPRTRPDVQADCRRLPFVDGSFDLILADTPYGESHCKIYECEMPNRLDVTRELARVLAPGGFLVWLDTKLPMFRKDILHWCGIITVVRSTNHDFRCSVVFERTEALCLST